MPLMCAYLTSFPAKQISEISDHMEQCTALYVMSDFFYLQDFIH